MVKGYSRAQVISAEEEAIAAYLPGNLMNHAAAALSATARRMLRTESGGVYGRRVLIVAGSGDNGADALYAGVQLRARGVAVAALATGSQVHDEAWRALMNAGGHEWHKTLWAQDPDLIIDGVVGLNGRPGLTQKIAQLFESAGAATSRSVGRVPVLACDTPSGIDIDHGICPELHVVADATVAMGALKAGMLLPPAAAAVGELELAELPAWPQMPEPEVHLISQSDVAALWPHPAPDAHKYTRGVVGLAVGSVRYPGAAVMAVSGASSAGVGMMRLVSEPTVGQLVLHAHPEVVLGTGRVQAWVLGCGWEPATAQRSGPWMAAIKDDGPIVADAGALSVLHHEVGPEWVLTPHAGELCDLLAAWEIEVTRSRVEAQPAHWVQTAMETTGATILLKGPRTLVASPGHPIAVIASGSSALATAGSGDVLAGVIGALLAQGLSPWEAAAAGAWVHGRAGTLASENGQRSIRAADLAEAIPSVVSEL